jgi:deoxycytidylate deaminase
VTKCDLNSSITSMTFKVLYDACSQDGVQSRTDIRIQKSCMIAEDGRPVAIGYAGNESKGRKLR